MARSKSSSKWLREHFNDEFVKRAQQEGWRSRAAFKLLEIQQRDKIIKPGMVVVDLGAAPGGWSQVARQLVGRKGKVIAVDLLPIEPIADVEIIQGDFLEDDCHQQLQQILQALDKPVDVIIADLAPNISGIKVADQARAMLLVESAFAFAQEVLTPGGHLLTKAFQGADFDNYMRQLRQHFGRVITRKPQASRARSRELYVLAMNFKG